MTRREHLAIAELHVAMGERRLSHHLERIADMERTGDDAREAKSLLQMFEQVQAMLVSHCNRVRAANDAADEATRVRSR